MGIRLSHTAKELYLRCPLAYYMHYILNLRSEKVGSPLPFGSAIDEGVNELLEGKSLIVALKKFDELWENPKINNVKVDGKTTELITFSKADQKEELADTPWESLKIKGHMLIEAYQLEIMPSIKDVLAVQKPINITNNYGDRIIGFADIIVETVDGRRLVMDNKTSAKSYPKDAVYSGDKAKQLALYFEALKEQYNLDGAGFYVIEKGIRKREPQTRIQTLIDEIPETVIQKTFEEYDDVLTSIKLGKFHSNSPECNMFYGDCICDKYAKSFGQDLSGLIEVKRKQK